MSVMLFWLKRWQDHYRERHKTAKRNNYKAVFFFFYVHCKPISIIGLHTCAWPGAFYLSFKSLCVKKSPLAYALPTAGEECVCLPLRKKTAAECQYLSDCNTEGRGWHSKYGMPVEINQRVMVNTRVHSFELRKPLGLYWAVTSRSKWQG